ncbi:MAG: energy-coupling factor transporter transmembrane component T [Anaerolineales bacterium]|nr:energy-coupling factor transporter transmembrane component T [Anaerolineales bacterium]
MAGVPLIVLQLMYPGVWRGALTGRRLVLLGLIAVPPLFLVGEVDRVVLGVGLSSEGVRAAVQIALRFVVVMVALEGMTNAVEIAAIAGLLERLGLKGLGFSMGVALNLLPCLQQSLNQSWQTLKMRGGLRKQWWRGLRLFALTASSCALMRAEEIALAAETRGFHPEKARPMGTQKSRMDWVLLPLAGISLIISLVL